MVYLWPIRKKYELKDKNRFPWVIELRILLG